MRRALAMLVAALALGCTSTAEIPWDVRVADSAIAEQAAVVVTSIRRGGCEGVPVYGASIARGRRGPPPSLGRGLHGFAAEARDLDCRTIARGCVERDLPLPPGARVELVLEPALAAAACDPARCTAGECSTDDGGTIAIDAAIDPPDGGTVEPPDGGTVEPPDAGACGGTMFGARCYEPHAEPREWSAAEAVCASSGGHLTSLGGPEEASFVRGIAGSSPYWIGLHDLAAEGIWQWVDGSTSSHRDWVGGTDRNRDQNDCVQDQPGSGRPTSRCRETLPFVCER